MDRLPRRGLKGDPLLAVPQLLAQYDQRQRFRQRQFRRRQLLARGQTISAMAGVVMQHHARALQCVDIAIDGSLAAVTQPGQFGRIQRSARLQSLHDHQQTLCGRKRRR